MEDLSGSEIALNQIAEEFEDKANEILERFIKSMEGDPRFTENMEEFQKHNDGWFNEDWAFVYTDRGARLVDRINDRLYKVAEARFGDWGIDMEISSSLYQEE